MKITLKTLPQATAQQVFDQVKSHLLSQNEKSLDGIFGDCTYRGTAGKCCAAGCLIADEEYDPKIEGETWRGLLDNNEVPKDHYDLIIALQNVHDNYEPENWPGQLAEVAKEFKLTNQK